MLLALIFVFGVLNFALQKAVFESGHPMLERIPWLARKTGRRMALALEFGVLFAAMLLAANGWPGLAAAYGVYTALNAITAWMILTGRV